MKEKLRLQTKNQSELVNWWWGYLFITICCFRYQNLLRLSEGLTFGGATTAWRHPLFMRTTLVVLCALGRGSLSIQKAGDGNLFFWCSSLPVVLKIYFRSCLLILFVILFFAPKTLNPFYEELYWDRGNLGWNSVDDSIDFNFMMWLSSSPFGWFELWWWAANISPINLKSKSIAPFSIPLFLWLPTYNLLGVSSIVISSGAFSWDSRVNSDW